MSGRSIYTGFPASASCPARLPGLMSAYFVSLCWLGAAPTGAVGIKYLNYCEVRSWGTGWQRGAWSSPELPPLIQGAGDMTSPTSQDNASKSSLKNLASVSAIAL